MDLWSHLTHQGPIEESAPSPDIRRDPDLDMLHRRQHDLMNRVAAHKVRDEWNRRVRESWRPQHSDG